MISSIDSLVIKLVFTISKLKIIKGHYLDIDNKNESTINGPSISFNLLMNLEEYWYNYNKDTSSDS